MYIKLDSLRENNEYGKTTRDYYVSVKKFFNGHFIILLLYVVDMLIFCHEFKIIISLNKYLRKSFPMNDLCHAEEILDMRITCGS